MTRHCAVFMAAIVCGGASASIIFRAEPPGNIPAASLIAQVLPTPVSRDILTRRMVEFGVTASPEFVKTPFGLASSAGNKLVVRTTNGTDLYADTSKLTINQPSPAGPISDATATSAANSFASKHFSAMFADGSVRSVGHLMDQAQDLSTGQLLPAVQSESIVQFTRTFNGVPVVGPGDGARIHVANTGEVTGAHIVHRRLGSTQRVPLLPYSAVQQTFMAQLSTQLGDGHEDAIVTKIEFGLYSRAEHQRQGWYHPCYLFYVSFHDNQTNQDTGATVIPVAAIDPALLKEPLLLPEDQPVQGDSARISFAADPPVIPTSVPAYPITPTVVNGDSLLSRASTLGFTVATTGKTPRGLTASDSTGNTVLYEDVNGAEFFGHMNRFLSEKPGESTPIADSVATRLAADWIGKSNDVNPTELGVPAVQHLFHQTFDIAKQAPGTKTQDETIVTFKRRKLGAPGAAVVYHPVLGEGDYIEVHVDNGGHITGHHRVWRNTLQATTTVETRPYSEILQRFIRRMTSEMGGSAVIVSSIQFGYYSRGEGYSQGYLQPCVLFDVKLPSPTTGQITGHRQVAIPASAQLLEPLEDPSALDNPMPGPDSRLADSTPIMYGDLNGDGKVDLADVALALQMAGGLADSDVPPAQFSAGDIAPTGSPDNAIQVDDATRILRGYLGLEDISNG